ncbi:MAG: hypothetical protein EAZ53_04610 [Bacteroidetes bacterium]|nr:MAG: hypothetical protein EAZ53_04610 [Bacteroidota bacterium]
MTITQPPSYNLNLPLAALTINKVESKSLEYLNFVIKNPYYILSETEKYFFTSDNKTIFLNHTKSYFNNDFNINQDNLQVIKLSESIFNNSKPINGVALDALRYCLENLGKKEPLLGNRL